MIYYVPFKVTTGAVADTYKTLVGIIVPDVAGQRGRLISLYVGPADATPLDHDVSVLVKRIASVSGGTAGTAGTTITAALVPKADPGSENWLADVKLNYSVEPTVYDTNPTWQGDYYTRGSLSWLWLKDREKPMAERNMMLGLLAAPRAAQAIVLSGVVGFERY